MVTRLKWLTNSRRPHNATVIRLKCNVVAAQLDPYYAHWPLCPALPDRRDISPRSSIWAIGRAVGGSAMDVRILVWDRMLRGLYAGLGRHDEPRG